MAKFYEILTSGFGTFDPDAEAWAKLCVLKQRNLTAPEYVHQMRACFNGITVLPSSAGEKIERFLTGLNPELHLLVATAPMGLGLNGKWLDPNSFMSYAVQQSQALASEGASRAGPSTYLEIAARKRPHEEVSLVAKQHNAAERPVKSGFRSRKQIKWLAHNNRCYYCTETVQRKTVQRKKSGSTASAMPAAYPKA